MPSYDELIFGACEHMDTNEKNATLKESELKTDLNIGMGTLVLPLCFVL